VTARSIDDEEKKTEAFVTVPSTKRFINKKERKAAALRYIAVAQADAGKAEEARNSFAEALGTARAMDLGPAPAFHFGPASAFPLGLLYALTMTLGPGSMIASGPEKARVLMDIAVAQAKTGWLKDADETVSEALQIARFIPRNRLKAFALCYIAAAQANAGWLKDADDTVSEALQTAHSIDDKKWKAAALRYIAVAQANAGWLENARKTFAKALQAIRTQDVYGDQGLSIADAQAGAGLFAEALQTARSIDVKRLKAAALRYIAVTQAEAGWIEDAHKTFAEAVRAAHTVDNGRQWVLEEIATAQAEAGLFAEALQTASTIDQINPKASALGKIANAQAHAGLFAEALGTAHTIANGRRKAGVLKDIAVAQIRATDGFSAVCTAELITFDHELHLPDVAKVLSKANDRHHFKMFLPLCMSDLGVAISACGSLALLYPKQAVTVAHIVLDNDGIGV
jgi:tetratricopeptide (TPR) repeat protein